MAEYATIPEPQASVGSLHEAVVALKQTVEALTGQRGTTSSQAATKADLAALTSRVPSYTVATLPPASSTAFVAYVSDETGGAVLAFSDGTNWRRVTDRAIVS